MGAMAAAEDETTATSAPNALTVIDLTASPTSIGN